MNKFQSLKRKKDLAFITQLQKKLPQAEIFLVGGIVRDTLLDMPSKDYDFVVTGVPVAKLEDYLARFGPVSLVGKAFGVFKFQPEGAEGGGRPLAGGVSGTRIDVVA